MEEKFYSEEQAEQILQEALRTSSTGGMSRDRLLATAAELGISPDAIAQAEYSLQERLRAQDLEKRELEEKAALRKRAEAAAIQRFRHSVGEFFGVAIMLLGIDYFITGNGSLSWSLLVLGIWAAVGIAGLVEYLIKGPDLEQELKREARRQRRRERRDRAD